MAFQYVDFYTQACRAYEQPPHDPTEECSAEAAIRVCAGPKGKGRPTA